MDQPDRAQSATARALGYSPAAINRLMHGSGGSLKLVNAVAELLGESPHEILHGKGKGSKSAPTPDAVVPVRDLPGFAEAIKQALDTRPLEAPDLTVEELERLGNGTLYPTPAAVYASDLFALARWLKKPPPAAVARKRR